MACTLTLPCPGMVQVVSSVIQWVAWRGYSLRGERLREVQATMAYSHKLAAGDDGDGDCGATVV